MLKNGLDGLLVTCCFGPSSRLAGIDTVRQTEFTPFSLRESVLSFAGVAVKMKGMLELVALPDVDDTELAALVASDLCRA